jgi:molybdopterin/thiamine biosynthesis adenylyltransferase
MNLLDYQRYGRQMILDGFGLTGQISLFWWLILPYPNKPD